MGIWDFFTALFWPAPVQISYANVADEKLLLLWRERGQLTEEAKQALQIEAMQRGLSLEPQTTAPVFNPQGVSVIESESSRVALNEPRSDDDETEKSNDGLVVARRLLETFAGRSNLEAPALTFVDAALLVARSGESLPPMTDSRRQRLADLCCAAASRDPESVLAISDQDEELALYRDALLLPLAPGAILSRAPNHLPAIARTPRELAEQALRALADKEIDEETLVEATLVAIDLAVDPAPLLRRWKRLEFVADERTRHFWRVAEVRRLARTDLQAALELEQELPGLWRSDETASLSVAARLAQVDANRAIALASKLEPDLDNLGWLAGCVQGGAPGAYALVEEWIAALGPHTYNPYGYFRGVLQSCLQLDDVRLTRRCLEAGGATGWQVAHAARWQLGRAQHRQELLKTCLNNYPPGPVAGRAVESRGSLLVVGNVVIRPAWLDFARPHPVETLSVVAALGEDAPAWERDCLP